MTQQIPVQNCPGTVQMKWTEQQPPCNGWILKQIKLQRIYTWQYQERGLDIRPPTMTQQIPVQTCPGTVQIKWTDN